MSSEWKKEVELGEWGHTSGEWHGDATDKRSRRAARRQTVDRDEAEKDASMEVSRQSDPAMEDGDNKVKERKLQAHNDIDQEHDRDESKKDEAIKYVPKEDRLHREVKGKSEEAEMTQYLKFKELIFCVNPCV